VIGSAKVVDASLPGYLRAEGLFTFDGRARC
jgi:hypothetical protein